MKVLIPQNPQFNYKECKKLFEETQSEVEDYEDFDWIVNNTFFYSFIVGFVDFA